MNYIEVAFQNPQEFNEVLIAFLSDTDFEMFEEKKEGLCAYMAEDKFVKKDFENLLSAIPGSENIVYSTSLIEGRNWNEEWEKNFEAVRISNKVLIRAPFHSPEAGFDHTLVIEPKMSFGTGHHATTVLMIELMLEINFKGKSVLDMGCGSGVLAILAHQLKAKDILAVDFDQFAYENSIENCERNNCKEIIVEKGNVEILKNRKFDIILANINRNILLADGKAYSDCLNEEGILIESGFLQEDETLLITNAEKSGMKHAHTRRMEKWSAMLFNKIKK